MKLGICGSAVSAGTVLVALWAMATPGSAQQRNADAPPAAKQAAKFDPHDISGSWINTGGTVGDTNPVPEPPLTPWAKEHLLIQGGITHAGLNRAI